MMTCISPLVPLSPMSLMLSFILCLYIISFPFAGYASYVNFWSPHCFSSLRVNTLDMVPSCDLHGLSPPPMQGCVYFEECVIQEGKRSPAKRDKEGRTRISKTKTKKIKIRRNKNSFQSFVKIIFHFHLSSHLYLEYIIACRCLDTCLHTYSLLLEERKPLKIHKTEYSKLSHLSTLFA